MTPPAESLPQPSGKIPTATPFCYSKPELSWAHTPTHSPAKDKDLFWVSGLTCTMHSCTWYRGLFLTCMNLWCKCVKLRFVWLVGVVDTHSAILCVKKTFFHNFRCIESTKHSSSCCYLKLTDMTDYFTPYCACTCRVITKQWFCHSKDHTKCLFPNARYDRSLYPSLCTYSKDKKIPDHSTCPSCERFHCCIISVCGSCNFRMNLAPVSFSFR